MPLFLPLILGGTALAGWAFAGGQATNAVLTTPQQASANANSLDLTKLAGYAIAGGLLFYFGKKIIK
ncbi:MAG: hypothetical protein SFU99_03885 [Saprospiraceae bacterium]|nr:hypothetical protein [Saprospiraceae bacterium]